jgi:hypothetical protein
VYRPVALLFLVVTTSATAAEPTCVDRLAARLDRCEPLRCQMKDERVIDGVLDLEIVGRQKGLCLAEGKGKERGSFSCELSAASVAYLRKPQTLKDLQSPKLEARLRAPQMPEEAMALVQGHLLFDAMVEGRTLRTDFVERECRISVF